MASNLRKLLLDGDASCDRYCAGSTDVCPITCCLSACPSICKHILTLPEVDFSTPHVQQPQQQQQHRLSLWLTLSLAVLATVFFFFICYAAYRIYATWYNRRRTSPVGEDHLGPAAFLQDEDQGPVVDHPIWYIRTIGLQHSVISAITVVKYKRDDRMIDGTDCAICLNEFEEDESLRLLPKCNHAFHIPCIDTWLRSHTNCPMCRAGIVPLEPASGNPVVMEEDEREVRMGPETVASELRIGIDDADNESRAQIGLTNNDNLGLLQPVRRSVSVDSFPASPITASIVNTASSGEPGRQLPDKSSGAVATKAGVNQSLLRFVGSFSMERSAHMGGTSSSSVKRSLSCSAKVFQSRHSSRSHDSGMPPRNEPLNSLGY